MAILINDKEIDRRLEQITLNIQKDFGIKNCSKSDAIRFLLGIRRQGKKTNRRWQEAVRNGRW